MIELGTRERGVVQRGALSWTCGHWSVLKVLKHFASGGGILVPMVTVGMKNLLATFIDSGGVESVCRKSCMCVLVCTGSCDMCTGSCDMCTGSMCVLGHVICVLGHVICLLGHVICVSGHVMCTGSCDVCTGSCDMCTGSCHL